MQQFQYSPGPGAPYAPQRPPEDRIRQLTTQRPMDFQSWWGARQASPLLQQQQRSQARDAAWRGYNQEAALDRRERGLQERAARSQWQQRLNAFRSSPGYGGDAGRNEYGNMMEQYRIWEGRQRTANRQWEAGVRANRPPA